MDAMQNPVSDGDKGPDGEPEPAAAELSVEGGVLLGDANVVQTQLRFLATLHKDGGGLSPLAYAGHAVFLAGFVAAPWLWFANAAGPDSEYCYSEEASFFDAGSTIAAAMDGDEKKFCNGGAWAGLMVLTTGPWALAIWSTLCRIGAPDVGAFHAVLDGVERLSTAEVGEIKRWGLASLLVTAPISFLVPWILRDFADTAAYWICVIYFPAALLCGALSATTLKTATVACSRAVAEAQQLVAAWAARLPRSSDSAPTPSCVDEIGVAIVAVNGRVSRLAQGWAVCVGFTIHLFLGITVMTLPNLIRRVRTGGKIAILSRFAAVHLANPKSITISECSAEVWAGDPANARCLVNVVSIAVYLASPLALIMLPAGVTDACIELETRLSDLLIPNDPSSKDSYVVSHETSQQLQVLDKYMQKQNNRQGSKSRFCLRKHGVMLFAHQRLWAVHSGTRDPRPGGLAALPVAAGCCRGGGCGGAVRVARGLRKVGGSLTRGRKGRGNPIWSVNVNTE